MYRTADICDIHPQIKSCEVVFNAFGGTRIFSGFIRTIKTFEDNSLLKTLVSTKQERPTVIVVDGGGSKQRALLGDNLAKLALENNITGSVINGCVRDTHILTTLPSGILALTSNPRKSNKENKGEVDVKLNFWGIDWIPGEYLYADEDGIIVLTKPVQ
jgi:regulator of ribonuclease activity A